MTPATKVSYQDVYFPAWIADRVREIADGCDQAERELRENDLLGQKMMTDETPEAYALWGCAYTLRDTEEILRNMQSNPADFVGCGGSVDGELNRLGCIVLTAGALLGERYTDDAAGALPALLRSLASNLVDLSLRVDERRARAIRRGDFKPVRTADAEGPGS